MAHNMKIEQMIELKENRIYLTLDKIGYDITDHMHTLLKELQKIKNR